MNKYQENIIELTVKAKHDLDFLDETFTDLHRCANVHNPLLAMVLLPELEQVRDMQNKIAQVLACLQDQGGEQ